MLPIMWTATSIRIAIEAEIASGALAAGDRLSSVRDRATALGVSPNTVAAAYKQLRDRGVVVGRGRQGTVVAPERRPTTGQVHTLPDGVIDAMRGSPDPELLPGLGSAFASALGGPSVRYGDELLDPGFERATRSMFEADGIEASALAATSGAMDAIERILDANDLRPGDRVGVEDPGHVPVHQLVRSRALTPVPIAVDEFGPTPVGLRAALRDGLSALIVTPRAHNPTGAAFDAARADELSGLLAAHPAVLVVHDDHAGPVSGIDPILLAPPGDRFAVVRSFGKSLGPDLRVAAVAADTSTIDRVAVSVSNGPGWVSHLLQRAVAHLLTDPRSIGQVGEAAATYAERRRRMIDALNERGVRSSGRSGLNVWIPTSDEQAAVDAARAAGFAIRAADSYRIAAPPAVRVTTGSLSDDEIDALAAALGDHLGAPRRAPTM